MSFSKSLLALIFLTTPAFAQETPAPPAPESTLPGGAASTTEEHGDWTVSCRMGADAKQCVLSQALADSGTGERVLALELAAPTIERAEGMLLAPFGLQLANGVQLAVDGVDLGAVRPFLTCIPTGCLVPITFGQSELSTLRSGTSLSVTGTGVGAPQPVVLNVSLSGFTAGHNRTVELGQ